MASTIQIKRGTGSAVPTGLADGELAINLDNGKLYFGSGSTSVNDFTFGEITAEKYIVSSSVLYVTTSFSSGSTEFGDSADDTHTFTGNITASGNIQIGNDAEITSLGNMTFRIDSDANEGSQTFTFRHNASTDIAELDESGVLTLYGNQLGQPAIELQQNTQTATFGPPVFIFNRTALASDNGDIGRFDFKANDDATNSTTYAQIIGQTEETGNGTEGGKITFKVASHDAELQTGLLIEDGDAEDEVDVTIGNTTTSLTTVAGNLSIGNSITSNITSSGNISSSGTITANAFVGDITGDLTGNADTATALTAGNKTLDGNLTIGAAGGSAGHDLLLYGDTNNQTLLWDASEDFLKFTDGTKIVFGTGQAAADFDSSIQANGSNLVIYNDTGDIHMGDTVIVTGSLEVTTNITASGNISSSGEIEANTFKAAGNVDFNGDLDVDGTTNLDAVDIDGNVQLDGTLTVGVSGTGHDVTLFGDTNGKFMKWDQSQDHLKLYDNTNLVFGTGVSNEADFDASIFWDTADLVIDSETDIKIVADGGSVIVTGEITSSGNISSSGTITANAFVGDITGDLTGNASTATALTAGNKTIDGNLSIGAAGGSAGHDLKLYGDTNNQTLVWDASEDFLKFTDGTKIVFGTGQAAADFDSSIQANGSNLVIYNDTGDIHMGDTVIVTGSLEVTTNITSSANISSSGTVTADRFVGSQLTMVPWNYFVSSDHSDELYIPQGGSQVEVNSDQPYNFMLAPYDGKVRRLSVFYQTGDPGTLTARVRAAAAPFDLDDADDIKQALTQTGTVDDTAYFFDFSASFSKGDAVAVTLEAADHLASSYVVGCIAVEYDTTT